MLRKICAVKAKLRLSLNRAPNHDVNQGRAVLNFSTWNQLSPEKQAEALKESWEEVAEGEMPTWYYVVLHPEARLSPNDRSLLQAWSGSATGKKEDERDDD